MSRSLMMLREKLSALLNIKTKDTGLVNKQLAIFDHIVSRRQFLGGAGKLSALTILVNSGLAPSVWASQSSQYQITDDNLQLSEEEQAEMARAATITLSGELIDDQLLIKTGGEITNTDNHHVALYAGHPLPYIQTSTDDTASSAIAPTQIELISLDSDAVIRHTYRDYNTGHGFMTQEVAKLSSLSNLGLDLSNINSCRIHAFNHPMSGQLDPYGYTVDMMMVALVDPNNNAMFFYKTRRVKFNNGTISPDNIVDTGWRQYFTITHQKLIQILVKDGYPYFLIDDIHDVNVISFGDLYTSDQDFNPYCPLRISKIENPSKAFFADAYTTNSTFNNSLAIRLFNLDRSTGQYNLLFLPNQKSRLASGTDIWYSCQNYNGGSSVIYLEGGNIIRKTLFATPNSNPGYSVCKLTGTNIDSTGSFYEENLTTANGWLAGNIKCIKLQRNCDGLYSIYATTQSEQIYKLRQYSQKVDDNSLTSPFVAANYVLSDGTLVEGAFECSGGQPGTAQWAQLYENMLDILVPPLSDNESDYFTINSTGYSLCSAEKYTLMMFSERLLIPMSEAEIAANTNLATKQITDTFFHGEINVLDTSGLPVKDGIKVELRASRTCRIIDNKSKYSHTITRSQSAILETNSLGRVIISTRADDMTAPTLFARIYDEDNSLSISNNCVELSEQGQQYSWYVLTPDSDAHARMADTTYTTTDSLTNAGIITSDVPSGTQSDVTQIMQSAGSALATTADSATPEDDLQSSEWKTHLSPLTHHRKLGLRRRKWKTTDWNGNTTLSFSFPQTGHTSNELTAGVNYSFSIFHSIGHLFSDLIHSLKHNVTILIDGIAREITRATINFGNEITAAYHFIENGVEKSVQFILDTAEHVAQAVTSIITKITSYVGDLLQKIIAFIKYLFSFGDILSLTKSIKKYITSTITTATSSTTDAFSFLRDTLGDDSKTSTSAVSQLASSTSQNTVPSATLSSSNNSCASNYAQNKFLADCNSSSSDSSTVTSKTFTAIGLSSTDTDLTAFIEEIAATMVDLPADLANDLLKLVKAGFSFSAMGNIINILNRILLTTKTAAIDVLHILERYMSLAMNLFHDMINTEVPFIGWLLKLFGIDFTISDLLSFIMAFTIHTIYLIMYGKSLTDINGSTSKSALRFSEEEGGEDEDVESGKKAFEIMFTISGGAMVAMLGACMLNSNNKVFPALLTFSQISMAVSELALIEQSALPLSFRSIPISSLLLSYVAVLPRYMKFGAKDEEMELLEKWIFAIMLIIKVFTAAACVYEYNNTKIESSEKSEIHKMFCCLGLEAGTSLFEFLETCFEENKELCEMIATLAPLCEGAGFIVSELYMWGTIK